jgi:type I restriction enzyme S subunit
VKRLKHLALGLDAGIQMGPFGSMLKELVFSDTGYKVYGQENTISGNLAQDG